MLRRLALLVTVSLAGAHAIKVVTPLTGPTTPTVPTAAYRPADPLYAQQWNLQAIHMEGAWAVTRGAPVTVAVLDTGYHATAELAGRTFPGYDFVSDPTRSGDGDGRDANPADPGATAYHGSLVAQIIGAAHDGRGVAGINPQARLLEVRVADAQGTISVPDLVDALRWAAGLKVAGAPVNARPARVINLSLFADFIPLTGCDARVQSALDDVARVGAVVIAGAANDGADARGYTPAGCRGVITVTATDDQNRRPTYANYGSSVAIAAPGGTAAHGILTNVPESPQPRDGTSLAAPHVAGVVSLMLGLNLKLTPAQVKVLLRQTARPFPGGTCDPDPRKTCGAGLLDAARAVTAARPTSAR